MNQRGAILLSTLWIIILLSLLAIGISSRVSLETHLGKYNIGRMKAIYLAYAGVAKCQDLLSKDTNEYDSLYYCGVTQVPEEKAREDIRDIFENVPLSDGTFTVAYENEDGVVIYGMADEERKININKADHQALVNIFRSEEIADAVMDWRDKDAEPKPLGAENSYYSSLKNPYKCKDGEFTVLEELLLVKGITPVIFDSVKRYITIYGDGKININTVSKRVLIALGMTENAANALVQCRNGPDGIPGTKDDFVFTNVNIETILPDLRPEDVVSIGNLKNLFTVKSNCFKIKCAGVAAHSGFNKSIEAILKRDKKCGGKLIQYHE